MHTAILTINEEQEVETFSISPGGLTPGDRSKQRDLEDWLGLGYQVAHTAGLRAGALLVLVRPAVTKGAGR